MAKDNIVKTLCRDCVFSEYQGNVQVNCQFARLERFEANGGIIYTSEKYVPIKEVVDNNLNKPREYSLAEYEHCKILCRFESGVNLGVVKNAEPESGEEIHYFTIPRYCNKCRNESWALDNEDEDLRVAVCKEAAMTLSIIIYLDENSILSDYHKCVDSINKQSLYPTQVIVLNNSSVLTAPDITSPLETLEKEIHILWQHIQLWQPQSKSQALEEAYLKLTGRFFAEVVLPCELHSSLVEEVDIIINERCERAALIEYRDNPNIFIAQTKTIKPLEANFPLQLEENGEYISGLSNKIHWLADKNNEKFMIKTI